jgi:hypothetical protein
MKGFGKSWRGRIVSEEPLRYWAHFTLDKDGRTTKVNCTLDESCPIFIEKTKTLCAGNQPEARYYIKFLDRKDNKIKVLDVGKQIVNGIGGLIDNPDWGHCKDYDITIKKGAEGTMPLYTVEPAPHKALTAEELVLVANSDDPDHEDFLNLEERIQPHTAEFLNKILKGDSEDSAPKKSPPLKSVAATTRPAAAPQKAAAAPKDEFEVSWDDE